MKKLLSMALAAALAASALSVSTPPASAEDMRRDLASQHDPRFWWPRAARNHHHDRWHHDFDDDDFGGVAAAGIIGFATGALVGSALNAPTGGHVARCRAHYQSYDVRTDTFLGYDGDRHYCRL
jgi:hypothetical protein